MPDRVLLLDRHAHERADHDRRHLRAALGHVVEGVAAAVRVEELGAQLADAMFEQPDPPRRERAPDELAQPVVARRVHHDHHRRVAHEPDGGIERVAGVDRLEQDAARRAERLPVEEAREHVVVAAYSAQKS